MKQRQILATFAVAGIGAILVDHALKPSMKRKFKVK